MAISRKLTRALGLASIHKNPRMNFSLRMAVAGLSGARLTRRVQQFGTKFSKATLGTQRLTY